ncbi:MAG: M48 family metalloprotease [Rhodocyclales bacterium]|nr:M48 family metalloprotease [Rhodocyclales bacterium]
MRRLPPLMLLALLAAACSTAPEIRKQLQAPPGLQGFSAVYSEFDMRLQLVTSADAPACGESDCLADRAFDQRILAIGRRLADVAFRQHPDLHLRFPRFEFVVADKRDPGAASSSAGTVVLYRGIRSLDLDDAALAFVLAREMSHIIDGHHDENVTTAVLVGVAAQILFPILNLPALVSGSAATTAAATSAATSTVTTTAVASAASFAGSRALRASFRPQQVIEAEAMAMELLAAAGWDGREVAEQLQAIPPSLPDPPAWTEELRESIRRIASLMQGPPLPDPVTQTTQILPRSIEDLPPPLVSKPF